MPKFLVNMTVYLSNIVEAADMDAAESIVRKKQLADVFNDDSCPDYDYAVFELGPTGEIIHKED